METVEDDWLTLIHDLHQPYFAEPGHIRISRPDIWKTECAGDVARSPYIRFVHRYEGSALIVKGFGSIKADLRGTLDLPPGVARSKYDVRGDQVLPREQRDIGKTNANARLGFSIAKLRKVDLALERMIPIVDGSLQAQEPAGNRLL